MFISISVLKKVKHLHTSPGGKYVVIENIKKEVYEKMKKVSEEHLPNYLIVNKNNGAIEFATDQLPNACMISGRLEHELSSVVEPKAVDNTDVAEIERQLN